MHLSASILLLAVLVGCASSVDSPPPIATPGEATESPLGSTLRFNGEASQGVDLRFQWNLESAPPNSHVQDIELAGTTTPYLAFTPDVSGAYKLSLTVCDVWSRCAYSELPVQVHEGDSGEQLPTRLGAKRLQASLNQAPRARASASVRRSGGASAPWVFLDGQGSFDPDGDTLRYTWSFASRPAESALNMGDIEGQGDNLAAFRPDAPGTWVLRLTVSDLNASSTTILEDILINQNTWDDDLPTD